MHSEKKKALANEKRVQYIAALTAHEWIDDEKRIYYIFEHTASQYNRDTLQSCIYEYKQNRKEALRYTLIFIAWIVFSLCVFENYPEPLFWSPFLLILAAIHLYGMTMRSFRNIVRKSIQNTQDKEQEDEYTSVHQLILADEVIQVRCMEPKSLFISFPYARKSRLARFFLRGAAVMETEEFFVFCDVGSAFWVRKNRLVKGNTNTLHDFLRSKGIKFGTDTLNTTVLEKKLQSIISEEADSLVSK